MTCLFNPSQQYFMIVRVWVFSILLNMLRYFDEFKIWVWKFGLNDILMSFKLWWEWDMIYVIYDK